MGGLKQSNELCIELAGILYLFGVAPLVGHVGQLVFPWAKANGGHSHGHGHHCVGTEVPVVVTVGRLTEYCLIGGVADQSKRSVLCNGPRLMSRFVNQFNTSPAGVPQSTRFPRGSLSCYQGVQLRIHLGNGLAPPADGGPGIFRTHWARH